MPLASIVNIFSSGLAISIFGGSGNSWIVMSMSSITFSSFIFFVGGFVIVIVCEPNNDGFGSVSVKLLNNDGGGGKFLNGGGGGGNC